MSDIDAEIEDADETPPEDTDRRKYLLALFTLLLKDTKTQLTTLVTAYLTGSLTITRLQAKVSSLLLDAHAHATYLGRQLAGNRQPFGRNDQSYASTVMFAQVRYLDGLMHDLENGRYPLKDDGTLAGSLAQRLTLYANGLRNTADEVWVRSLPQDTLINWVTTAAESCEGCLAQEAANPHKASEMHDFPGDEECGPNCRCYLETINGESGFELD